MGFGGGWVGWIRFEFQMGWVGLEFGLGFDWFEVEPIINRFGSLWSRGVGIGLS